MKEYRIEVGPKDISVDLVGAAVLNEIKEDLKITDLTKVNVIDVFNINADINEIKATELCKELFVDPVIQVFSINKPLVEEFDFALEVSFLPDVTDNIGITAKRGTEDFLGRKLVDLETIRSAKLYLFFGEITKEQVQKIAEKSLSNPIIHQIKIWTEKK